MKILLILLLLVPTLAMSKVYKKDGKFTLKTSSKSGFKYHMNFMDHNDYNFKYIKDKKKARAGKYFQQFELKGEKKLNLQLYPLGHHVDELGLK